MASINTKHCPSCGATNMAYAATCIACSYALPVVAQHQQPYQGGAAGAPGGGAIGAPGYANPNPYGGSEGFKNEYRESFSVGRALGATFSAWFKNAPMVLTSVVLLYLPIFLATHVGSLSDIEDGTLKQPLWIQFYGIFVQSILAAMVTFAVVQSVNGTPVSFATSFSKGLSRMLPVLGVSILVALVVMVGVLLLVVPGVIFACMLFVAVPASVMEAPGVMGALSRSRALTLGNRAKIFGLCVAIFLAFFVASLIIGATAGTNFSEGWAEGLSESAILAKLNWAIGIGLFIDGISSSFLAVAAAVVYCHLRQSQEGTSTQELAAVFQ